MVNVKTYEDWKKFCQGRETVSIRYDRSDVYVANHPGLFPVKNDDSVSAYMDWIEHRFRQEGIEITRFFHNYSRESDSEYWGLVLEREDSDLTMIKKLTAIIGVNARRIHGIRIDEENTVSSSESGGRSSSGGGNDHSAEASLETEISPRGAGSSDSQD